MKNIIVISDTHGRLPNSETLWEAFDGADYVFHLGDGAREIDALKEAYPDKLIYVFGNADGRNDNQEQIVEIEGVKFFLTHGHNYKVKSSDMEIHLRGLELGAHCCLHGHVHTPSITDYADMKIIDPGSLGYAKTYCYMNVVNGKILAKIVNLRAQ